MDRLKPSVCEFAVDAETGRMLFKGDFFLDGANFNLINALLENHRNGKKAGTDIAYIAASDLAQKLGIPILPIAAALWQCARDGPLRVTTGTPIHKAWLVVVPPV